LGPDEELGTLANGCLNPSVHSRRIELSALGKLDAIEVLGR
jgi:hypothetical protein